MAVGSLITSGLIAASFGSAPYDDAHTAWDLSIDISAAASPVGGALTNTQPITEEETALTGSVAPTFVGDYYNRLHFSSLSYDMGNVIGAAQRTLEIWNAYFQPRTLNSIDESGTEGINLTRPTPEPAQFRALEQKPYTFDVTTEGPGIINAVYTFTFDSSTALVSFEGSRITAWMWGPNGAALERLEWKTDVITSYDGTEQRIALRSEPRRYFEWDVMLTDGDRRKAENVLYGWQARVFGIPVWFDGTDLTAQALTGATSISLETADRDYHAGGLAMITISADAFEIFEIDGVTGGGLDLVRPLINSWPAGARVYPVRLARMADQVKLQRFTGAASYGRLRWQCVDASEWTPATETTYLGFPVLSQAPNWVSDVTSEYMRKMQWLDNGISEVAAEDESGVPTFLQSHRWLLDGRSQVAAFRAWLYARRGRLSAFWLPSWSQDLVLTASVGALAVNIDVAHCNYTKHVASGIGRRDIRIELISGTVLHRRIISCVEVDANTERMTLSSNLGQIVNPADVRLLSFMALCRNDADAAELSWWRWDVAEASINIRSIANDA
jgi:hypothetical protein